MITAASRGHGGVRARERPAGPARAARAHRGRLHLRRRPGDRRRPAGGGRDDRDHEGRDQAEPGADARGPARARPRRAVRQHRPREQLDHRGPRRAEARRLRRHRGRVRERPRLPEVLRHRVPRSAGSRRAPRVLVTTVRATKSHGGMAFADLGTEDLDALRRGIDNLSAHINIVRAVRAAVRGVDQQLPHRHRGGDRADRRARGGRRRRDRRREPRRSPQGGDGAVELAEAVVRGVRAAELVPTSSRPRGRRCKAQIEAIATRLYGADGVDYLPQAEKDIARMDELGFGDGARLHGEDPPVAQPRPAPAEPADAASACRCAAWCRAPGQGSWSCSAATCSGCPGLGKTPHFMGVDIDARRSHRRPVLTAQAPLRRRRRRRHHAELVALGVEHHGTRCCRPPRPSSGAWRRAPRADHLVVEVVLGHDVEVHAVLHRPWARAPR